MKEFAKLTQQCQRRGRYIYLMEQKQFYTPRKIKKEKEKRTGANQARFMESFFGKFLAIFLFIICAYSMTLVVNQQLVKDASYYIGLLTSITLLYFLLKIVISFFYTPVKKSPLEHKVSVIISNYNESVESVKNTINCLLNQDYPIHEIIFVDDGSQDDRGFNEVLRMSQQINNVHKEVAVSSEPGSFPSINNPKIVTHRFKKNQGKRAAQAWAFEKAEGDILFLIDSDGYIFPDALKELLKPFRDSKVNSVVGHILPRNYKDTFLTRVQDVLYTSAFRVGRGAQSVTNTVLVCSGALSVHRKYFVLENLEQFKKGKVLGIVSDAGDDRALTMFGLRNGGKTKYQSTALCITDVPDKTKKFFTQQVRWARSFYLYTVYALKDAWKNPFYLFWLLGEGTIWLIFGITTLVSLFSGTAIPVYLILLYSMGYLILSSLMHGIYYIFRRPLVFLLAPIFAIAHTVIIIPVRIYALLTIKNSQWGTR